MARSILVYGSISGLIVIVAMIAGLTLSGGQGFMSSQALGYLIMLIALSLIFVAVKQHRDEVLGGVIKFWPAFGLGLGVAAVAGLVYVIVWEIYLAATDYQFMEQYAAAYIEQQREAGLEGEALDRRIAQMEAMAAQYRNPLFRLPVTFSEIFPIGALIALVSAALLRNPRFAPKKAGS